MAYKIANVTYIDDNRKLSSNNFTMSNANSVISIYESEADLIATEYFYIGTRSGYTTGGGPAGFGPSATTNIIDKFPFAIDANATDVGDLTQSRSGTSGFSSPTNGYIAGGSTSLSVSGSTANVNTINKIFFASDANASDIGDLDVGLFAGAGNQSEIAGYVAGGVYVKGGYYSGGDYYPGFTTRYSSVRRLQFSNDNRVKLISTPFLSFTSGDEESRTSQTSREHAYFSGGSPDGGSTINVIERFPFATETTFSDVGDLTSPVGKATGHSSTTHGYVSGGAPSLPTTPGINNHIEKFPFSSNSNATDVGDLATRRAQLAGHSSSASGYVSGGQAAPPLPTPTFTLNSIEKFPFATDSNASDVGDLTQGRMQATGLSH